ncbi:DUF397 domain-containing protein [Actinacidiphila oryziradicis]|uniref:DUF397 domain-containing protein n=1 Tax=Actinacidiphila oryziradicis TaxID=2571141 RepID=A0A4U0SJ55_9ACTN|nr:DUF397 domain-containing protein [Actinacidiphila oryziradicis]TKA09784.1 DUF397 domain-containing protein [Actinacidiphila oryziradicis]
MTSPIAWQKSSFSHGECVELAAVDGAIRLRESDDPGVVVNTSQYRLKALILAVKAGEFDDLR